MHALISSQEQYDKIYKYSIDEPENFWAEIADEFTWHKKWDKVLEWNFTDPDVKWFIGGKLNITENILDRHLLDKSGYPAIIWEPNNPEEEEKHISYQELYDLVCRMANVLKSKGIQKGDRICIYMPMIPELAVAVLACARIGAIHTVVFAGFSAQSLADRLNDCQCKLVFTSDGGYRGNKELPIKSLVDEALTMNDSVTDVIVCKRTGIELNMQSGRDYWWHDAIANQSNVCTAEEMDSEDMLFILYTSGSTGQPKGVVHTCGGYMVYTWYTFETIFRPIVGDIFWCTADLGWITGHSYGIYGPLLAGATTVMFEGIPSWPDSGRFWQIIDKYKITQFYTAPTAIRSLMAAGLDYVKPYKLDSLKLIGSVGEPINEEAWYWYYQNIGKSKCPLVDTWWQTETGGCMISPIPGVTKLRPSYASNPLPGVQPVLLDTEGNIIEDNEVEGLLCIKFPWPSIIRTTYGNHQRCKENYFSSFKGYYFTGDGAKRDSNGNYRIIGRVDDVLNISGHRLGTAELENAINAHIHVIESAVVGFPHDIKGQGIYAYVITENITHDLLILEREIIETVSKMIGPIAKPDKIQFVNGLPKTRSGKIMRRILRKIASKDNTGFGDISTLLNPEIVDEILTGSL